MATLLNLDSADQFSAIETVQAIKAEALKGSGADDGHMAELIRRFVELVPTGRDAAVEAFNAPPLVSIAGRATESVLEGIVATE